MSRVGKVWLRPEIRKNPGKVVRETGFVVRKVYKLHRNFWWFLVYKGLRSWGHRPVRIRRMSGYRSKGRQRALPVKRQLVQLLLSIGDFPAIKHCWISLTRLIVNQVRIDFIYLILFYFIWHATTWLGLKLIEKKSPRLAEIGFR